MVNVYITGGCGYIGSRVYTELHKLGFIITSIDLETYGNPGLLNNEDTFKDTYINDPTGILIHLGSVSSVSLCKKFRYESIQVNVVEATKFMLERVNVAKMIYASSSCLYGKGFNCTEETPPNLTDDLSIVKYSLDSYMQISCTKPFYGLRFGSVNGWSPNLRTDLMINSMNESAKNSRKVLVSNPEFYRPIISTQDVVSSILAIINSNGVKSGIYNVHSYNQKIGDIATEVANYHSCLLYTSPSPRD